MKESKQKIVECVFWDCGIDAHMHKTKKQSDKCISVQNNKNKKYAKQLERINNESIRSFNTRVRRLEALKARCKSKTLKAAAKNFGLSDERLRQLGNQGWRQMKGMDKRLFTYSEFSLFTESFITKDFIDENRSEILSMCDKALNHLEYIKNGTSNQSE